MYIYIYICIYKMVKPFQKYVSKPKFKTKRKII